MAINDIVQTVTIPPAPPTGLYDADFQTKVADLLTWYNTHAVEETTFIEKLNTFISEVNGTVPLINNGLPVSDYLGDINNTFLVANAVDPKHAVNLEQLQALTEITVYNLTADTSISLTTSSTGFDSWTLEIAANGWTITWDAGLVFDGDGTEPEWSVGKDLVYVYTLDGGTTKKAMRVRAGA